MASYGGREVKGRLKCFFLQEIKFARGLYDPWISAPLSL